MKNITLKPPIGEVRIWTWGQARGCIDRGHMRPRGHKERRERGLTTARLLFLPGNPLR